MRLHEVDDIGLPLDPKMRELELQLCILASTWRGHWGDETRQEEIVHEYHEVIEKLYMFGWDGHLDMDCQLPDSLMPEKYFQSN